MCTNNNKKKGAKKHNGSDNEITKIGSNRQGKFRVGKSGL
jgi:hypothetical protein